MKRSARGAYLGMARLFLAVGGVVGLVGIADRLFGLDVFRGSPVPTSLFLLVVGVLLYWTAATAPGPVEGADVAGDAAERPADERAGGNGGGDGERR